MSSMVVAGRYELDHKIGDGGMAVVYKARDRVLNRPVAIKILKPEFVDDSKFIENFRRESHAAASLSNANIVSIFDVGREGNINYIVMELVEGKALSEIIAEEAPMDYRDVIDLTRQIALGLSAAHKRGIVHRDIKPHNILVNEDGIAKIADFGIAKAVSTTTIVENNTEDVMGSVHYFSPEQARGGYVDEKSDIYSLGIVMYEMLTGEVPFDGENPVTIALKHINQEMIPPSAIVGGIPPALEAVVMKACDKLQTNRFESADELIDTLDNLPINDGRDIPRDPVVMPAAVTDVPKTPVSEEEIPLVLQKKRSKLPLIIVLICVVAAAAIFGTMYSRGVFVKKVEVPDLKGLTLEQARATAKESGLKIKIGEKVYSEDFEIGDVIKQKPKAKTEVKEGTVITVDICRGVEEEAVPGLIGMSKEDAKALIAETGFTLGEVTEVTSTEPGGQVIDQDPDAGTIVQSGSEVNITVSNGKGKEKYDVPNILGMSRSEAESALEKAGFQTGEVTEDYSNDYEEGQVMSQQYSANTQLEEGSTIDFVVSKGAKEGSVNLYIDYEDAEEDVFYMTVTVSDDSGTRNIVSNEKRNKQDSGETLAITGTGTGTITVLFNDKTVMQRNVDFSKEELT